MNVVFFEIHIFLLIFLSLKLHLHCIEITKQNKKKNLVYRGLLEYVANSHGSWILKTGAPPRSNTGHLRKSMLYTWLCEKTTISRGFY